MNQHNNKKPLTAWLVTAALALALTTALIIPTALAHNAPGYSHDSGAKTNNPRWMTALPDTMRLHEISIPGTHDTMSFYGGDIVQTQSMSLPNQLNSGVRALDVRCRSINNVFAIHHGIVFQNAFFGDVLNQAVAFLQQNPGETILMRVKEEHTPSSTLSFEQIFQNYFNQYQNYFWQGSSNNPTLGEIRGKIVVLQNFSGARYGIPYGSFNIQDNYSMSTNWDLYDKWEDVKTQLHNANNDGSSQKYMNYLSASGGSFPYFVASGHSSPGTGAPRLATGLTTPGWKSSYPDFPRVSCFIGICTIAFEGTNELTYNLLRNGSIRHAGIVMADFPGPGLINEIIKLNPHGVTLYQHGNFGGYRVSLDAGDYRLSDLVARGVSNDDISSIKVAPGYQVEVFQHDSFGGWKLTLQSDNAFLGGYNDNLSSVRVTKLGPTLYQHNGYGGYGVTLGEGSYNLSQLTALGIRNDDISSIRVPQGYQIAIFEHSSFNGVRLDFTSDTASLGGFNDKLSSVIVYRLW